MPGTSEAISSIPSRVPTRGGAGCLLPAPGWCRAVVPSSLVPNHSPGIVGRDVGWHGRVPIPGGCWAAMVHTTLLGFLDAGDGLPAGIMKRCVTRVRSEDSSFLFSCLPCSPSPWHQEAEGCVSSRLSLKRLVLTIYLCKGLFLAAQLQLIQ